MLLFFVAVLFCHAALSQKEPKDSAKDHFYKGLGLFHAEKYSEALEEFEASYQVHPHWKFRYNIAMCHYLLNHNTKAAAMIAAFLEEGKDEIPLEQVNQAKDVLAELKKKTGTLRLKGKLGASAVIVDGKVLEGVTSGNDIYLSPGKHTVKIVLGKNAVIEEEIVLEAGKVKDINVKVVGDEPVETIVPGGKEDSDDGKIDLMVKETADVEAVPGPYAAKGTKKKMSTTRIAAWATLAGGLGLWLGCAVTGGLVFSEKSAMRDAEDEYREVFESDPTSERLDELMEERDDHYEKGNDLVLASNVLFGLGSAFMAAMAVLFIVSEKAKGAGGAEKRPALSVGPAALNLRLNF